MADSTSSRGFKIAHGIVKTVSILCGLFMTLLALMSVVGVVTGNQWVRLIVAAVVALALPAVLVDRLLPKDRARRTPGLAGDVFAVFYLTVSLLFIGVGWRTTQGLVVREADRLARADLGAVARVAYWLAGVKPVETLPRAVPPAPPVPRGAPVPDAGHALAPGSNPVLLAALSPLDFPPRHRYGIDRGIANSW